MLVLSVARSLRAAVPRQNPAKSQRLFDEHGGAFAVAAEEQNILHLNSLGLDFSFKPAFIKFLATWSRLICKHIANCCLFKHRAHTLDICIHQNYLICLDPLLRKVSGSVATMSAMIVTLRII